MLAKVKTVQAKGAVVVLEDDGEAWLPGTEWSDTSGEWDLAKEWLEPGEEVEVCRVQPSVAYESKQVVSRWRFTAYHVDASWTGQEKLVEVEEITRFWIRGKVGNVPVMGRQQRYFDYLDRKHLNTWAKDHAVIGRGDFLGAVVKADRTEDGEIVVDFAEYLERREVEPQDQIAAQPPVAVPRAVNPPSPHIQLPSEIAGQISPALLVEDNEGCREAALALLHGSCVVTQCADNSTTATAILEGKHPSAPRLAEYRLAIVDLNLEPSGHDHNGFAVLERLQALPLCRILLITGEEISDLKRQESGRLRVNACLLKPYSNEELIHAIEESLRLERRAWVDLVPRAAAAAPPSPPPPKQASPRQLLHDLLQSCPGAVLHVFELHERSCRARSLFDANGGRLDWHPFRGKIAKSPIKDAAFAATPIRAIDPLHDPLHFWTLQMMDYADFYGVPIQVPGLLRYALVAFHSRSGAFDAAFQTEARVCAEQIGRSVAGDQLVETATNFSVLAATGMTLEALAHELRNDIVPLTNLSEVLSGYITNLKTLDPSELASAGKFAGLIQRHARFAAQKIRALRGARAEDETVDVNECLYRAAARGTAVSNELIKHAKAIEITLPTLPGADNLFVKTTAAGLVIVLFNLYLNAAQQIDQMISGGVRQSGKIWHSLEVRRNDRGHRVALIRIHDTGPGIHPGDWERIFTPGFSTKPKGTGLGLHICRHLLNGISAHGCTASLRVTRSVVFDGTTFTLILPLIDKVKQANV